MKFIKTILVAVAMVGGVTMAGNCGNVTKKSYSDNNCKDLVKTETLPGKDSKMCQEIDSGALSYKISCEGDMVLYEYPAANCTGEPKNVAETPEFKCVKDLDTN